MFANVFKKINKPLFKELILFSFVLYSLNNYAWTHHLYFQEIGGEFDSLMHFLGGFSVTIGSLWLYFYSGIFAPRNRKYPNFFFVSLVSIIFVGFAWETYEVLEGSMSVLQSDYIYDTTLDVIFDTLGAIVACIYAFKRERQLSFIYHVN